MIKDIVKSVLAGMSITIGCNIYLSCENKYIGALLFSIGLITILLFEWNLFTGKVCYIPQNNKQYILEVATILIGNTIGCSIFGRILSTDAANIICQSKLALSPLSILIKAIMCNILIYIAVDTYKAKKTLLPTLFCIPVFILSGYEHSIADIAYFTMANAWSWQAIDFVSIVVIGNIVGGMLIPMCKFIYKE